MNRPTNVIAGLVALAIVGFVVLALFGHDAAGYGLLAAVPALAVLVVGKQVADARDDQGLRHLENTSRLATIETGLADVTSKVEALHNGALVPVIAEGFRVGLGDYLTTSGIVEHPYLSPLVAPVDGVPDIAGRDITQRLVTAEETAAKSRP